MPMHDQPYAAGGGEVVDDGKTVFVRCRGFVRHQDIEFFRPQPVEILGENRVAVPQRQAAAPSLVLP